MKDLVIMAQELGALEVEIKTLVEEYNKGILDNDFSAMTKADTTTKEKLGDHATLAMDICFEELKTSSDDSKEIMIEAIKRLSYQVLSVKDEKSSDNPTPVRIIQTKDKAIDILKLDKYCGGIGFEADWYDKVKDFNVALVAWQYDQLRLDPAKEHDSIRMSDLARDLKFSETRAKNIKNLEKGKERQPLVSNSALLRMLKDVTFAMIETKSGTKTRDVNYITTIFSKKNSKKALSIATANDSSMRAYLAEVCHRVLLNKEYEVDVKFKDLK